MGVRYGDEAHLDTTIKALGLVMPQKAYPQMQYLEYAAAPGGEFALTLVFQVTWASSPFKAQAMGGAAAKALAPRRIPGRVAVDAGFAHHQSRISRWTKLGGGDLQTATQDVAWGPCLGPSLGALCRSPFGCARHQLAASALVSSL